MADMAGVGAVAFSDDSRTVRSSRLMRHALEYSLLVERPIASFAMDPELERMVTQALNSPHGAALDPGVADVLAKSAAESAQRQENLGHPACLLVPDMIRAPMARLLKRAAPRLKVLSHSEIPETHSIRIGSIIGAAS